MDEFLHRGWAAHGARHFVHYCGAKVIQRGRQSWAAKRVDGIFSFGHESVEQAIQWIEAHDPEYWTYGTLASDGVMTNDIACSTGFLDTGEDKDLKDRDHVVVLSLYKTSEFPRPVESSFLRLFLSNARCAKCDHKSTEIILRSLPEAATSTRRRTQYIVCSCGYPVWRISWDAWAKVSQGVRYAEYSRECKQLRKMSLRVAGGKYSVREIQEILSYQENRCIYCNAPFGNGVLATRDHLTPVLSGGADWALNIVMACRSCNSRRGTMPFRTYCKLLSPTQNRKILLYLARRVAAMRVDELSIVEFKSFCDGIAKHNPRNVTYRSILRYSAKARRNAEKNELLPSAPHLILRRVSVL
jgi:5-methylcytosine-specific restriction endonuclease McrA